MKMNQLLLALLFLVFCFGGGCDVGPITPPPEDEVDTDTGSDGSDGSDSPVGTDEELQNMWKCLICDDD